MQSTWITESSSYTRPFPKLIRLLCLFLLTGNLCYILANRGLYQPATISQCLYLQTFSYLCVVLTFMVGTYISYSKRYNGLQMGHLSGDRYGCAQAWKWFIILFELSAVLWLLLSFMFWTQVWRKEKDRKDLGLVEQMFLSELVTSHTLPPVCLLIDYAMNAVPFAKRHVVIVVPVTIINLLINIFIHQFQSVHQKTDKASSTLLDESSPEAFIFLQLIFVLTIVWFFMLYALNQLKLNYFAKYRCQESEMMLVLKM